MTKRGKIILGAVIVAVLLVPVALKSRRNDAKAVEIQTVATHVITPTILASGSLTYQTEIRMVSEVMGRVKALYVKEGDQVKQGDVLLRLDPATVQAQSFGAPLEDDLDFDVSIKDEVTVADGGLFIGNRPLPPLPQKLSPAQAARLAEILDFLHRGLTNATENVQANDEGTQVGLTYADWQKVLAVQMLLARYVRAVAEPDTLEG